jgi:hypothetical protein
MSVTKLQLACQDTNHVVLKVVTCLHSRYLVYGRTGMSQYIITMAMACRLRTCVVPPYQAGPNSHTLIMAPAVGHKADSRHVIRSDMAA